MDWRPETKRKNHQWVPLKGPVIYISTIYWRTDSRRTEWTWHGCCDVILYVCSFVLSSVSANLLCIPSFACCFYLPFSFPLFFLLLFLLSFLSLISFFLFRSLQTRLNEILKENKEFRSSLSLMETKVDQVMDENGALSSQVRMPDCS